MLHLTRVVEHEHHRDDGELATGTRRQVADATTGIGLDGRDKLLHVTTRYGLTRLAIHLIGIVIRRIMGEVAADDKEIIVRKPGLQHLGHAFQFVEVVGGDDDGYDRWNLAQMPL